MVDLQKIVDRWSIDKGSNVMLPWLGSTTCGEAATAIADALRQIAELRAERDVLQRMSDAHREHAQSAVENCASLNRLLSIAEARAEAAEAENARLRALPLKDEVERVLEEVRDNGLIYWEPNTARGCDRKTAVVERLDTLLSRLRAEPEAISPSDPSVTPGAEEAFAALDLADRLIERGYGTETPKEWQDEYRAVANARAARKPRLRAGVQEGWRSMDSAPKDGKHVLLCVRSGAFFYAVEGAFHREGWLAAFCSEPVQPVYWAPKPTGFTLPASPSVSEGGSRNG